MTGHKYLSGFIGNSSQRTLFVQKKVNSWVDRVRVFSDIAATQSQLAYVAVT